MTAPEEPVTAPEEEAYDEPLNPVEVEAAINRLRLHISRGVRIVSDAEEKAKEATKIYDRAYASAFLAHEGPQTEKRYAAELAPEVIEARDARDIAVLAYRHANRTAEALQDELRAYQSINKSVIGVYGATSGFGS